MNIIHSIVSWLLEGRFSPAPRLSTPDRTQRDINVVINQILFQIPVNEYPVLREKLNEISQKAFFTAPEVMDRWVELQTVLQEELGEVDARWARRIAAIFNDDAGLLAR